MARYQKPPDPRQELPPRRQRRMRADGREPVPWFWLGMGVLVTIASIAFAIWLAGRLLERPPLVAAGLTPTVIRLTAPPSPEPSPTPERPTPTFMPTLTPLPTPDLSTPPAEITAGYYAEVANTGDIGVTVRAGPGIENADLTVAPEGALMLVIGGPQQASELTWWQVRLSDGTEGWVAANFIVPAAAPAGTPVP